LDKGFGQGFKQPEGSSSLDPRSKTPFKWGQVRATPYGACLDTLQADRDASEWHESRNEHLKPLNPPRAGHGHGYGQPTINQVDGADLGATDVDKPETVGNSGLRHAHDLDQPEHLMTLLDGIFHANVKRPDDLIRLEHILYPQDPDTA
jgi:hypothetical protein